MADGDDRRVLWPGFYDFLCQRVIDKTAALNTGELILVRSPHVYEGKVALFYEGRDFSR